MALRHENAGDLHEKKLWAELHSQKKSTPILEQSEYDTLVEKLGHKGKIRAEKIYLDPEMYSKDVKDRAEKSKIGTLLSGIGKNKPNANTNEDTLESRTKEWFKAYSDWLNFTEDESV